MDNFKVGDRVKVARCNHYSQEEFMQGRMGETGTVIRVLRRGESYFLNPDQPFLVDFDNKELNIFTAEGEGMWFFNGELELA